MFEKLKKNSIAKYLYIILLLIISIFFVVYIIAYDIISSFSIVMNMCFFMAAILLILNVYYKIFSVDSKVSAPSFKRIFVSTFTKCFFLFFAVFLLFNILYEKPKIDPMRKYDYVIVFGCGIRENKTTMINSRIDNAVRYSKIDDKCKFVLTGAKGSDEPMAEAIYMFKYMVDRGVSEDRILIDTFSTNTYANIKNSLALIVDDVLERNPREHIISRPFDRKNKEMFDLDFLDIGFMSSDFHLTRIVMMAKKMGIHRPYVIECTTGLFYKPYMYIRETLSMLKAIILWQVKL